MPYRNPEDRRAACLRYYHSPKGKARAQRYYRERHPVEPKLDTKPLAQAMHNWKHQ